MVKLKLRNKTTGAIFIKEFDTEFARDTFKRKLRYSKNLIVVNGLEEVEA